MSNSTPILITVPSYVSLGSPSPVFKDYVECKPHNEMSTKGRKRRLDHLTWEEKLQRKKLKNRVAAQTSRDRKKVRMDDMEATIKDLQDDNDKLRSECKSLRVANKKLSHANTELKQQLTSSAKSAAPVSACSQCCANQDNAVDSTLANGSTVSSTNPLPQGKRVESAVALKRQQTILLVLKMLVASIMSSSPTSTPASTLTSWKSLLRAYSRISPQTWTSLLKKDRLQRILSKKIKQEKWWGRHQSSWNPVDL